MAEEGSGYWALVEPVWHRVIIYGTPDEFLSQLAALSPPQRHLLACHWCQSEVCNGGFHQFFTNPTGVLSPEAAEGFRTIGMPECARVVEAAMAFFGSPYPRGRGERERALADAPGEERQAWDPFFFLDDEFYDLLGSESGGFTGAADTYAARVAA